MSILDFLDDSPQNKEVFYTNWIRYLLRTGFGWVGVLPCILSVILLYPHSRFWAGIMGLIDLVWLASVCFSICYGKNLLNKQKQTKEEWHAKWTNLMNRYKKASAAMASSAGYFTQQRLWEKFGEGKNTPPKELMNFFTAHKEFMAMLENENSKQDS